MVRIACAVDNARSSPPQGQIILTVNLHHQEFEGLPIVRELDWPADVAHVFLLVVDPKLLVDGRNEIGNLDGLSLTNMPFSSELPQTRPPVMPAPANTTEKQLGR